MNQGAVRKRAVQRDQRYQVDQLATLAHGALIEYFDGEDLSGKLKSNTITGYAACITVLNNEGPRGMRQYQSYRKREPLRKKLEQTIISTGFTDAEGNLSIPARESEVHVSKGSIGPLLPMLVGVLEVEFGIDAVAAVREHLSESAVALIENPNQSNRLNQQQGSEINWDLLIQDAVEDRNGVVAYVYVLELERLKNGETWFYVGESKQSFPKFVSYLRSHASNFKRARVIQREDRELMVGSANASMGRLNQTHRVVDLERIVTINEDEVSVLPDEGHVACYIANIERRTAFDVAREHDTSNVLGGK